jgi:hypothetical protein
MKMTPKNMQTERLGAIFNCIDSLKADLNKAKSFKVLKRTPGFKANAIKWSWNTDKLFRNNELVLDDVTDFRVSFFPDANSVLYRIEMQKKDQIRGYIFLHNLKSNH